MEIMADAERNTHMIMIDSTMNKLHTGLIIAKHHLPPVKSTMAFG
jgi:hypothetical protein